MKHVATKLGELFETITPDQFDALNRTFDTKQAGTINDLIKLAKTITADPFWNALFDQEVLCAGNTPFGECLVIPRASTLVGMAFQSNLCIRLVLQIGLESEANSVRVFCWLGSRPPLGSCGLGLAVGK